MTESASTNADATGDSGLASLESQAQLSCGIHVTVATAPGLGGITEIHVWGKGSGKLVDLLFQARSGKAIAKAPAGRFLYGHIVKDGVVLDEVIVRGKETDRIYGAETVQIGCHGGGAAARAIIDALAAEGALETDSEKALEAAWQQGRISRIELDAHHALKGCASERALPVLLAELDKHHLEREIERIYRQKPRTSVRGSDADNTPALSGKRGGASEAAVLAIRDLLENSWAVAHVEPQPVFITGFPNVGKSSIFNALAGRERVIVHETPGTTRDVVEEVILLDKIPVRLLDAAGVGESKTEIEKLAEEFAFRALDEAALILFVFDGSRPVKETELKLYRQLDSELLIPIINKADLARSELPEELSGTMEVSALTGQGIEQLRSVIAAKLAPQSGDAAKPAAFTVRQRDLLQRALNALEAGKAIAGLEALGQLLGRLPGSGRGK